MTKARDKVIRVIGSCATAEQLQSAMRLSHNFKRMYCGKPMGDVIDFDSEIDYFMIRKALYKRGNELGVYVEPLVEPSLAKRYIPPVSLF